MFLNVMQKFKNTRTASKGESQKSCKHQINVQQSYPKTEVSKAEAAKRTYPWCHCLQLLQQSSDLADGSLDHGVTYGPLQGHRCPLEGHLLSRQPSVQPKPKMQLSLAENVHQASLSS